MQDIFIVIVVDVEGALASSTLMSNIYLVDNNQYIGSWQQGTSGLHTVCRDGQVVCWRATPINPGTDTLITDFSDAMVSGCVCQPKEYVIAGDHAWSGRVETQGSVGSFAYKVNLSLGSKVMSFNATLKVV